MIFLIFVAYLLKVDPPPVPEKKRKAPIVLPTARRSDDSDSDEAKMAEKVNFLLWKMCY